MFKTIPAPLRIVIVLLLLLGGSGTLGIVILAAVSIHGDVASCGRFVSSKDEAIAATKVFFNSDSRAATALISDLRSDGMTDDSLEKLKTGCPTCYIYPGSAHPQHDVDPDRWYAGLMIAEKKSVSLEINCAQNIRIRERLFGG